MDAMACGGIAQYTQEALLKSHAPLVKRIGYHLLARLPHSVQLEDLLQAGMIGLLEAAKHYDETKGASFETYAAIRIRGFMLDEIRNNDWVPRSVYRSARMIAEAVKKVEHRLGRVARESEIAEELELSLEDYYSLLKEATGCQLLNFEDLGVHEDFLTNQSAVSWEPQANMMQQDLAAQLAEAIAGLPPKEKLVLSLYYEHDLNLKEIGAVLSVSESRVSQIHTQATLRIRAHLQLGAMLI